MSDATEGPVAGRLAALREVMAAEGLDVYLVPSADEHQNEYLPPPKKRREAISGFTGSAGDVAVCPAEAHLFVDSRYHLQADLEVAGSAFHVHKLGLEGAPELTEWLHAHEAAHGPLRVGFDPFITSLAAHERLSGALGQRESALTPVTGNLVDRVWEARPARAATPAFALPDTVSGEATADKLRRVREAMAEAGAGALVLTMLDEVAWLTNLRGSDIPYNPVFEGFLVVEGEGATCFTDTPLPPGVAATLEGQVRVRPYGEFNQGVAAVAERMGGDARLWLDRNSASHGVRLLAGEAPLLLESPNPVARMKAVKNPIEIECSHEAHLKAGSAKVRAFSLLHSWLAEGKAISEAAFADMLEEEYAREEGYKELSFNTISAFGANGAIVHYGTPDPKRTLEPGGMLLVDSGVQYLGATTDDTRTIAIGPATDAQRTHYTDVLRAHIRLATQVFPEGTNGQMLDAITRSPLWNAGCDYGHGTGHGVGAFLNVHEGPQNISPRGVVPLEPGMIVSNEPGYYRAGWGGIRLENLMVVEELLGFPRHPSGRRWLRFVPLTLIPFARDLIDVARLTPEERGWLEDYHRRVAAQVTPRLEPPHRHWLEAACRPLG